MKRVFLMPVFKFGTLFLLAAILALGVTFAGSLASGQTPQPAPVDKTLHGQVASLASDHNSFILKNDDGEQVTVNVDQNTTYLKVTIPEAALSAPLNMLDAIFGEETVFPTNRIPGMPAPGMSGMFGGMGMFGSMGIFAQLATFADIAVGDIVTIQTVNANLASDVAIFKFPDIQRVHGTIMSVDNDSITIIPSGGNEVTVNWDNTTRFILKGQISVENGQIVTVMYRTNSMAAVFVLASSENTASIN